MTLTRQQAGAGVGGVGLGVITAELAQQGSERGVIPDPVAGTLAVGSGVGAIGLAAADLSGVLTLPPGSAPFLGGYAAGTIGWYAGRAAGVAPRIVVGIPDEIDLTGPLISAGIISTLLVGLEAGRRRLL